MVHPWEWALCIQNKNMTFQKKWSLRSTCPWWVVSWATWESGTSMSFHRANSNASSQHFVALRPWNIAARLLYWQQAVSQFLHGKPEWHVLFSYTLFFLLLLVVSTHLRSMYLLQSSCPLPPFFWPKIQNVTSFRWSNVRMHLQ